MNYLSVHPDLHVFPTRRSSDLRATDRAAAVRVASPRRCDRSGRARVRAPRERARHRSAVLCFGVDDGPVSRRLPITLAAATLDRKSTRLNSSHVEISYAVFCLK